MVQIGDLAKGPYWKLLGMKIVDCADGRKGVELEVTEDLLQVYGNVYGGVLASILDSAIAVTLNQLLEPGEGAFTVEMKLNFLRPAKKGRILGLGTIIQKGRRIIVGQGEIKDEEGKILAFGTATFMVVTI